MAFNPYNDIKSIIDEKAKYETTKASGKTGYDQYHTNAQGFYENLRQNGYGQLADELQSSDYMTSRGILDRYSPDTEYSDPYAGLMEALSQNLLNYGDYQNTTPAPSYQNQYNTQINDLLSGINNYRDFQYDPYNDELYSQYKKEYTREGKRATEDAVGSAAALTGGIPSTAAVTAASQAGDYYASQMADKIPELYQVAYNKYLNDFQQELSKLNAYQNAEQSDYAKYLQQLAQYNTERNFDYNAWLDNYNRQANNLSAVTDLSNREYARYLDEQNLTQTDRSQQWAEAEAKAKYGDLSGLQNLGIDTSNYSENDGLSLSDKISLAKLGASYGDYSGLESLGINPADQVSDPAGQSSNETSYTADELTSFARTAIPTGRWSKYGDFITELYNVADQSGINDSQVSKILSSLENYAKLIGYEGLKEWIDSYSVANKSSESRASAAGYQNSFTVDPQRLKTQRSATK